MLFDCIHIDYICHVYVDFQKSLFNLPETRTEVRLGQTLSGLKLDQITHTFVRFISLLYMHR